MTSDPLAPEVDCWTHPAIEVCESPIEGRGLFATEHISRGELVARLGGRIVNTAELHHLFEGADQYVDSITVAEDRHLVLPPRRTIGYGNHSCDPNLWWDGPFNLVARHDIEPGD